MLLLCSLAGVSRSVTITAMYIMLVTSLTDEQALTVVKQCRPQAGPNFGFRMQLQKYYTLHAEKVCSHTLCYNCVGVCVCIHIGNEYSQLVSCGYVYSYLIIFLGN